MTTKEPYTGGFSTPLHHRTTLMPQSMTSTIAN